MCIVMTEFQTEQRYILAVEAIISIKEFYCIHSDYSIAAFKYWHAVSSNGVTSDENLNLCSNIIFG